MKQVTNNNYNPNPLDGYYNIDPSTGSKSINFDKLKNKAQAQAVYNDCIERGRAGRIKAIGKMALAAGTILAGGFIFSIALEATVFAVSLLSMSLMANPALFFGVASVGGLSLGIGVGTVGTYHFLKKFLPKFYNEAKAHWNEGNLAYDQGLAVELKMATLKA